jgi:RNA polymerase sigma-70 factor (ECF subfamily)
LLHAYRAECDNYWLGLLLQRYTALLLGVALKYLKDKTLAEDAVQQVFVKVLTHIPSGEIQNFKGWLYILMRNHCLQQLRDKTYNTGEEKIEELSDDAADREELLQREYTLQQMEEAIEQLPGEQRQCIVLFYLRKYSYEQIINATGYTFMQVKSYIQNGKRNLKTILLDKLKQKR